MKTKLIIFDLDGTLVDSKKLYIETIHGSLLKNYLIFPKSHIAKSLGPKVEFTLKNIAKFDPKIVDKLKKEINEWIVKETKKLKLCPYVKQTLKRLKKEKVKIVLLTNSARKYTTLFLKRNKLDKFFNRIFCAENFKTKKEAIRYIAKKYKVKKKEIIYVADKKSDVKTARKVGCKIIIVLACSWDKAIFKKRKQKFIIKDLTCLKNAIR
ncbi:MAG: HAD-IA family hydrolase [Candidatus Pacearchaeota archaeon]|nr:MAG: HAD-IA family hydrolase [Candidatus Pacearchaeota archaeon]